MADTTNLPYLTPDQLLQYQQGKMLGGKPAATLKNLWQTPAPYAQGDIVTPLVDAFQDGGVAAGVGDYLQEKPLYDRPMFGLGEIAPALSAKARELQQPNLDSTPFVNNLKGMVGGAYLLPENAIQYGVDKVAPIANKAVDAVTKTEREIQAEEQQKLMAEALADEQEANLQQQRIAAFDKLMAQGDAAGGAIIGPASSGGGGFTLPMPPGPTDYSGVQDAVDQTKPVWDEAGINERRKGAIITGLIGGVLKAAINGEPVFENAGLGTLQGMAVASNDRRREQELFKKGIEQYWMRTADVRRATAESEADYANRVYQTRVQQLKINADAAGARAKANGSVLRQSGDKFFVEETVQTPDGPMRRIRPLDTGLVSNAGGMERHITQLLGGTEEAKKKAGSIVAEVVARKDPDYAMPAIVTARMKENGSYLSFAKQLAEADPDWGKAFGAVGTQGSAMGLDDKQSTELAERRRDAMIMEILKLDPVAREIAYKYTGMNEQYLKERQKQQELLPTLK